VSGSSASSSWQSDGPGQAFKHCLYESHCSNVVEGGGSTTYNDTTAESSSTQQHPGRAASAQAGKALLAVY
jgi:hypothetical protein